MSSILVTGVTGLIGGEVSKLLQGRDVPHRVLVRNANTYKAESDLVEIFEGRFEDSDSLKLALAGVSQQLPNFEWHGKCEAQLEASGIGYTHLQPAWVMQNFIGLARERMIRLPAGNGRAGFVDARDIAAVAVEALTKPGHAGKSYEMSSDVLTHQEIARIISEASGKTILFEGISLETCRKEITESGWPESDIATMVGLYWGIRNGTGFDALVTPTIEEVLGRPGIKFTVFAKDYASRF